VSITINSWEPCHSNRSSVLFGVLVIGCGRRAVAASFLLVAAGSSSHLGEMKLWR